VIARIPTTRRVVYWGAAFCLLGLLAWEYGAAISLRGTKAFMSNPEDGKVARGSYANSYFGLKYRLPQGWTAGEAGPDPSQSGYYVLSTLIPKSELTANILIAAQDMFFGPDTRDDMEDRARDFQQAVSNVSGMIIDRDLTEVKVADHLLYRVDYSGVGLFRTRLATEVRCHVVSLNVTTRDKELLERLAGSRDSLSFTARRDAESSPPPCVKDYAAGDNILHKVDPVSVGPKFLPIPVRIIVGVDGSVKHVHVIRATDDQRRSIEDALYQWKLKPYEVNGRPSPVESGLVFKFTSDSEEPHRGMKP
jgi:hypothetical protein